MAARILTNEEYALLAVKLLSGIGRDLVTEGAAAHWAAVNELKQAHRLLCEGRKIEDLTETEQFYGSVFKGQRLASVHNHDGSWEPALEVVDAVTPELEPAPKPKKGK